MAYDIQTLIGDIRLELTDELKTRWTDAQIIRVVAIRRSWPMCTLNGGRIYEVFA